MKYLLRCKRIPWENILFFSFVSLLLFVIYRFVFPLAAVWFLPAFLLQFLFGMIPQLYSRKFGRIFTSVGAILLARSSWIVEPGLPFHLSDLVGLFLGSIVGIILREIILILCGSGEVALPKQSDVYVTQWMIRNPLSLKQPSLFFQTPFYFLFWLCVSYLCVFLMGFGFSFLKGLWIPEFLYLPEISSRTFLSVPTTILMSVSFPVLYFFAEERFSTATSREALRKHLFFGLAIGFFIQLFVLLIQTSLLPSFLSNGSNNSLLANRFPGLFIDSGSSSWLLPTLGILFIIYLFKQAQKTKEILNYLIIIFLLLLISYLGFHQAKTFWIIWTVSLFISGIWVISAKYIANQKILWSARIGLLIFTSLLAIVSLWSFSKLKSDSPLHELGKRYVAFQSDVMDGKGLRALKSLDETRFELLCATFEGIVKSPWVGNGLGSLPILLRDESRIGTKIATGVIDVPANFAMAILHDGGLLGTLILLLLVGLFVWERASYQSLFLLIIPFQFGMQVPHADGGFFALYLLFYPLSDIAVSARVIRFSNWFRYTVLILAIGLPLHYLLFFTMGIQGFGIGSEFRKEQIGMYQIQASVYGSTGFADHEFHGNRFEWKLARESGFRKGDFWIKSENSDLFVELDWQNNNRASILKTLAEPASGDRYLWRGSAPLGAEYLVLKINRHAKLLISKNYFSGKGEFRL